MSGLKKHCVRDTEFDKAQTVRQIYLRKHCYHTNLFILYSNEPKKTSTFSN